MTTPTKPIDQMTKGEIDARVRELMAEAAAYEAHTAELLAYDAARKAQQPTR